ncbi:hypothetical protein AAC387_Pa01g0603 [Persea americana]
MNRIVFFLQPPLRIFFYTSLDASVTRTIAAVAYSMHLLTWHVRWSPAEKARRCGRVHVWLASKAFNFQPSTGTENCSVSGIGARSEQFEMGGGGPEGGGAEEDADEGGGGPEGEVGMGCEGQEVDGGFGVDVGLDFEEEAVKEVGGEEG